MLTLKGINGTIKSVTLEKKARPNYMVLQETHFKYNTTDTLKATGRGEHVPFTY